MSASLPAASVLTDTLEQQAARFRELAKEYPTLRAYLSKGVDVLESQRDESLGDAFGQSWFEFGPTRENDWFESVFYRPVRRSRGTGLPADWHTPEEINRRNEANNLISQAIDASFSNADWLLGSGHFGETPELADLLAHRPDSGPKRWLLALFHVAWQQLRTVRLRAGRGYPIQIAIRSQMEEESRGGRNAPFPWKRKPTEDCRSYEDVWREVAHYAETEADAKDEWASLLKPDLFTASADLTTIMRDYVAKLDPNAPPPPPPSEAPASENEIERAQVAANGVADSGGETAPVSEADYRRTKFYEFRRMLAEKGFPTKAAAKEELDKLIDKYNGKYAGLPSGLKTPPTWPRAVKTSGKVSANTNSFAAYKVARDTARTQNAAKK